MSMKVTVGVVPAQLVSLIEQTTPVLHNLGPGVIYLGHQGNHLSASGSKRRGFVFDNTTDSHFEESCSGRAESAVIDVLDPGLGTVEVTTGREGRGGRAVQAQVFEARLGFGHARVKATHVVAYGDPPEDAVRTKALEPLAAEAHHRDMVGTLVEESAHRLQELPHREVDEPRVTAKAAHLSCIAILGLHTSHQGPTLGRCWRSRGRAQP